MYGSEKVKDNHQSHSGHSLCHRDKVSFNHICITVCITCVLLFEGLRLNDIITVSNTFNANKFILWYQLNPSFFGVLRYSVTWEKPHTGD